MASHLISPQPSLSRLVQNNLNLCLELVQKMILKENCINRPTFKIFKNLKIQKKRPCSCRSNKSHRLKKGLTRVLGRISTSSSTRWCKGTFKFKTLMEAIRKEKLVRSQARKERVKEKTTRKMKSIFQKSIQSWSRIIHLYYKLKKKSGT